MFKYTLTDKFRQRGVLPNASSSRMYDRFDALIEKKNGEPDLNCRVQVRLDDKFVRFFFYYGNTTNEILLEEKYREIASISLMDRKETGNNILEFCHQVETKSDGVINYLFKQCINGCVLNIQGCCDRLVSVFNKNHLNDFPFVEKLRLIEKWEGNTNSDDKEKIRKLFVIFMQCILLYFILDIEDCKSDFALSPHYKKVCEKLHNSFVYMLLCAKLKYAVHFCGNYKPQNKESYSNDTRQYANLLMDPIINKVISSDKYPQKKQNGNSDVQTWFYNPEIELESILEKNRNQMSQKGNKGQHVCLNDNLVLAIRDFFYKKHAVLQAMTSDVSKECFKDSQFFMLLCSLLTIGLAAEVFEKEVVLSDWMIVILVFATIAIVLSILSGRFSDPSERKRLSSVIFSFFPRILVAELTAWLVIGVSEDLTKSMLGINNTFELPIIVILPIIIITIVVVLSVVYVILSISVKRHSPYNKEKEIFWKALPILNHSLFFALIFGVGMQWFFCDKLIKNSNVLTDVVFNEYFLKANNYCLQLENLDKSMAQYENLHFLDTISIQNGKSSSKKQLISSMIDEPNIHTNPQDFIILHNDLVRNHEEIRQKLEGSPFYHKSLQSISTNIRDSFPSRSLITKIHITKKQNLDSIVTIRSSLRKEISIVQNSILNFNNYDTLISWATSGKVKKWSTGSAYLDRITENAIEKNNCCIVTICNRHIFPTLLLLHTLLVLVLAFVTQLFISEKSVTEPL